MGLLRIHCIGGPEGDFWHEAHGTLMPNRIGLPNDEGVIRWFDIRDGVAYYSDKQMS